MPRAKLAKLTVVDLQKEIARRKKALPKLITKRDELNCQIAELEGLGGAPAGRKRGRKPGAKKGRGRRAKNATSLREVMIGVLKGRGAMSVADILNGALAAGYKTKSKTFRLIVNQMLSKDTNFKRVSRGRYALKG